jgi:hypothetical protein
MCKVYKKYEKDILLINKKDIHLEDNYLQHTEENG